jgi:hypothetical protein
LLKAISRLDAASTGQIEAICRPKKANYFLDEGQTQAKCSPSAGKIQAKMQANYYGHINVGQKKIPNCGPCKPRHCGLIKLRRCGH